MLAECPNHIWTYDFMFDALQNGRRLKILTVEDEFTREGLAIGQIHKGHRRYLRPDGFIFRTGRTNVPAERNGPEFIEKTLKRWLVKNGTDTIHIEPGKPWQNCFIESFNSKVRDEFLNMEVFYTLAEAQVKAEIWRWEYNGIRPHSSLKYQTPEEYRQEFFAGLNSATIQAPLLT